MTWLLCSNNKSGFYKKDYQRQKETYINLNFMFPCLKKLMKCEKNVFHKL